MTNEEALQILLSAAESLAELKIDGEMISFANDIDYGEGEKIREALAHLTKRAVDEGDSAPLQAESTPEHLPIEEADTTPPTSG